MPSLLTHWRSLALAVAAALLLSLWLGNRPAPFTDVSRNPALPAAVSDPAAPTLAYARGPAAPTLTNAHGPATLLVFTDYRCPNCRIDSAALDAFAAARPEVRVVIKDWPVLGPQSVAAARVALAAQRQGRYAQVHAALMAAGSLEEAGIRAAVESAGADWSRILADLAAHGAAIDARLARIGGEARALGLRGTPSYVSGGRLAEGRIGAEGLARIVAFPAARP